MVVSRRAKLALVGSSAAFCFALGMLVVVTALGGSHTPLAPAATGAVPPASLTSISTSAPPASTPASSSKRAAYVHSHHRSHGRKHHRGGGDGGGGD